MCFNADLDTILDECKIPKSTCKLLSSHGMVGSDDTSVGGPLVSEGITFPVAGDWGTDRHGLLDIHVIVIEIYIFLKKNVIVFKTKVWSIHLTVLHIIGQFNITERLYEISS